jgi:rare lipoprotein A
VQVWGLLLMRKVLTVVTLGAALALAGCASDKGSGKRLSARNSFGESLAGFEGKGSNYYKGRGRIPLGGGKYHVGKPYQVAGRWFTPKEQPNYDKTGAASWYGEAFHRRRTSNGEYFDMNQMTAAHPTLPLPSYARVTNVENGKVVVVRINDRGPFVGTRIIDLSKRSADALGFRGKGKAKVRVQWIGNAPINDDKATHLAAMNSKLKNNGDVNTMVAAAEVPKKRKKPVAEDEGDGLYQQANLETPKRHKQARKEAQILQVGSFRSREGAEAARSELSSIGPVQVFEWESDRGPIYKVQLGPFRSDIGAEDALEAVRNLGYSKAVLETARIEQVAYQH